MSIFSALSGSFTVLILIAAGLLMHRKGIITENMETGLTSMAMKYSIPCFMFANALKYMSREFMRETGWRFLIFFAVNVICLVACALLSRLLRMEKANRGLLRVMCSFSNTIFIGLPLGTAIFGDAAVPYIMTVYLPNTILFWTIGNAGIAVDGGQTIKFNLNTLKSIFPLPLVGFFVGSAFMLLEIKLPAFIVSSATYLGNMTVPLTLMLTGLFVGKMGKDALRLTKELGLTLFFRLFFAPLLTFCICRLLGASDMMTAVLTIMGALPTMNTSVAMSRNYGANASLAARGLAVTTVMSLIFIPLYVVILGFVLTVS